MDERGSIVGIFKAIFMFIFLAFCVYAGYYLIKFSEDIIIYKENYNFMKITVEIEGGRGQRLLINRVEGPEGANIIEATLYAHFPFIPFLCGKPLCTLADYKQRSCIGCVGEYDVILELYLCDPIDPNIPQKVNVWKVGTIKVEECPESQPGICPLIEEIISENGWRNCRVVARARARMAINAEKEFPMYFWSPVEFHLYPMILVAKHPSGYILCGDLKFIGKDNVCAVAYEYFTGAAQPPTV